RRFGCRDSPWVHRQITRQAESRRRELTPHVAVHRQRADSPDAVSAFLNRHGLTVRGRVAEDGYAPPIPRATSRFLRYLSCPIIRTLGRQSPHARPVALRVDLH